jgi:hypothetical protein
LATCNRLNVAAEQAAAAKSWHLQADLSGACVTILKLILDVPPAGPLAAKRDRTRQADSAHEICKSPHASIDIRGWAIRPAPLL